MFGLTKQVFIGLLSFSVFLTTEFVSLNNELYVVRATLSDLNLNELNYYPFIVSLDK